MKILTFVKNKRKTILISSLIISVFINIMMVISIKEIVNKQDAIKDCARDAYEKTQEKTLYSTGGKKEYNDYIYKQCLMIRYGITN